MNKEAFIAQLVYSIECEGRSTDQYEEQWRLIYADDETRALDEARKVAEQDEATMIDRHGRTIVWKLLAVKDLQPAVLQNGAMLFSIVKEPELVAAPVWETSPSLSEGEEM